MSEARGPAPSIKNGFPIVVRVTIPSVQKIGNLEENCRILNMLAGIEHVSRHDFLDLCDHDVGEFAIRCSDLGRFWIDGLCIDAVFVSKGFELLDVLP